MNVRAVASKQPPEGVGRWGYAKPGHAASAAGDTLQTFLIYHFRDKNMQNHQLINAGQICTCVCTISSSTAICLMIYINPFYFALSHYLTIQFHWICFTLVEENINRLAPYEGEGCCVKIDPGGGAVGGAMQNLDIPLARLGTLYKHFQTIILGTKICRIIRLIARDRFAREYAISARLWEFL